MTSQEPVRFDTKIVIVVRDDLAVWQKLNMTAFLSAGVAHDHSEAIGEHYADADGTKYPPTFGQPVLVFAATGAELTRTLDRVLSRGVAPAVYTQQMFSTGHDAANRAAVATVARADLELAGLAFRADRKDADKITKGLHLHS
jgi:hypothetical protein